MLKRHLLLGAAAVLFAGGSGSPVSAAVIPPKGFLTLCYHNVQDDLHDQAESTTTAKLVDQLSWLQNEGYQAVSLDDILAARAGKKPLPPKAVLLTFDDGYESFYTRVFPILQAFHYPAILGVVDSWIDNNPANYDADDATDQMVQYGDNRVASKNFLSWEQIRYMAKSGLVEIASHSHASHMGFLANPQGNSEPALITAAYYSDSKTYETAAAERARIAKDAQASIDAIYKHTGTRPRAMIWPYGAYNGLGLTVQAQHGMPVTFTLDDGFGKVDKLMATPRLLVKADPDLGDFIHAVNLVGEPRPLRVVQVDLDYVYDADPAQLERNLDALVQRVADLRINTVFLQAFADPKGDGLATSLYFPNRELPVRADLFNRVAWQLRNRAHVKVFGWLPVLSFDFGQHVPVVTAINGKGQPAADVNAYHRVSPFDASAREKIARIYEDMARLAPIDGLLFHDDAVLSDFEDATPAALNAYQAAGLPASIATIRAKPELMQKWTDLKIETLIKFTTELTNRAKTYRLPLQTVRDIYAPVVLTPESRAWFAQDYDRFLQAYDYTAVMAMPRMEDVPDDQADAWLLKLLAAAKQRPNGIDHTIFQLQTVDWRQSDNQSRAIPTEVLDDEIKLLAGNGAVNIGYYPDDFLTNNPNLHMLNTDFSLPTHR